MTKVIVFTDVHIETATSGDASRSADSLAKGIAHACKYNSDADFIIITGDLTHHGQPQAYALLNSVVTQSTLPVMLMIGNHDNRENFLAEFQNSPRDDNGFIQWSQDTQTHRLIFLDTLDGPPYDYPKSHRGYLCKKRMEWLESQLKSAGKKQCVVFMHHPPHDVGFWAMDTIKLVNGDALYTLFEKYGNVKHISCGHIHRTISGNHRGISFSVFKSTVGQMPMLFNSTDFSVETDEPAAYGILSLHTDGITVHTEDFGVTDLERYAD